MSKKKIVISVPMENDKGRSKVLQAVVRFPGVLSVEIVGANKGEVAVVGEGVDCVTLTKRLRKKMGGHAQIITIEAVKDDKPTQPDVQPYQDHDSVPPMIYYETPHDSYGGCTIF